MTETGGIGRVTAAVSRPFTVSKSDIRHRLEKIIYKIMESLALERPKLTREIIANKKDPGPIDYIISKCAAREDFSLKDFTFDCAQLNPRDIKIKRYMEQKLDKMSFTDREILSALLEIDRSYMNFLVIEIRHHMGNDPVKMWDASAFNISASIHAKAERENKLKYGVYEEYFRVVLEFEAIENAGVNGKIKHVRAKRSRKTASGRRRRRARNRKAVRDLFGARRPGNGGKTSPPRARSSAPRAPREIRLPKRARVKLF